MQQHTASFTGNGTKTVSIYHMNLISGFTFGPRANITSGCFFFLALCLKKLSPNSALLCLWLSKKTERLNSATRPLICDWVWEMREPSVVTRRELSAGFSLPQRPTAGPQPPQKHPRQRPPGAANVEAETQLMQHECWMLFLCSVGVKLSHTHTTYIQ